jgi:hypothetical protein
MWMIKSHVKVDLATLVTKKQIVGSMLKLAKALENIISSRASYSTPYGHNTQPDWLYNLNKFGELAFVHAHFKIRVKLQHKGLFFVG